MMKYRYLSSELGSLLCAVLVVVSHRGGHDCIRCCGVGIISSLEVAADGHDNVAEHPLLR